MDWKDMLSQLKADLPEGEAPDTDLNEQDSPALSDYKRGETIHVLIEKKGRKGKAATIAEGFKCSDEELQDLASTLKRKLGVGGSARGGEILIQGECKERLIALLKEQGYKTKG